MSSVVARYTKQGIRMLRRYLPIVAWLPNYRRADLQPHLVAGANSWAVMAPVAMAYAQMADGWDHFRISSRGARLLNKVPGVSIEYNAPTATATAAADDKN